MNRNIVIIGATSAIAQSVAKNYANMGDNLFLVARNQIRLESIAQDLLIRGAGAVNFQTLDLNKLTQHQELFNTIKNKLETIDIILIAYGSLPNQTLCQESVDLTCHEVMTNCTSVFSLLTIFANYLEKEKSGTIAVISSVAGDRGRQSNYIYGSSKAAITTFTQGLRNRLFASGVRVLTFKLGFVDTPMTMNFKKGLLWVKPEYVGKLIVNAIKKKNGEIYVPSFWKYIMYIIKLIPERIFCRMSL